MCGHGFNFYLFIYSFIYLSGITVQLNILLIGPVLSEEKQIPGKTDCSHFQRLISK